MNYLHSDIPEGMTAAEYRRSQPQPRQFPTAALWAIGGTLVFIAAVLFATVSVAQASPRAVSLSDARTPPTALAIVRPHHAYMPPADNEGRPCGLGVRHHGYFSDVSAYQWTGAALAPQRWDRIGVYYWNIGHGHHGRVTYDGLMWRNESRRTVLVAGWCES